MMKLSGYDLPLSICSGTTLDRIKSKLCKPELPKITKMPPDSMCHVQFSNTGIELINILSIFSNNNVLFSINRTIKVPSQQLFTTYLDPLWSTITSEVSIDDFLSDLKHFPCICSNSLYADKNHGYVKTGDIQLVENSKLHKLFCKEPKYRKPTSIKFHDVKKSILSCIDESIESWLKNKNINKLELAEWKHSVTRLL